MAGTPPILPIPLPMRPELQQQMVSLLLKLATNEGYTLSPLRGVRWLRSDRPLGVTPVLYEPGFVIVCQGRKRGWLGAQAFVYDEQQVLAVAVPVPFTMQTDASAERPLLAIYVQLDFLLAGELCAQMATEPPQVDSAKPSGLISTPLDDRLADAVVRFLRAMQDPLEARVLGPTVLREIYFRVLSSEQGETLQAALSSQGRFGQVGKAIQRIHRDHASALTVAMLARESAMGTAAFHQHFRAVTNTSPMQYLKTTRLHQARLLILRKCMTAAAAANAVGYESPSQFSREFKRLFGLPPLAEVERMKSSFSYPELPQCGYVSSH